MAFFRRVIIPGSGSDLLREELDLAFSSLGLPVSRLLPRALREPRDALLPLLEDGPALLFSVNFSGLERMGEALELLQGHGGQAAVWCVDNPWNLLAGVRDARWKTLPFFVTDASFLPALQGHGAERAVHLPLAASPAHFLPHPRRGAVFPPPADLAPFVFVGRSAFPGKEKFFAGRSLPEDLRQEAVRLLSGGGRPDFAWWEERLAALEEPLGGRAVFWPGKKARRPALGAEECSLAWRALCLEAAAGRGDGPGLDIFGDAGWQGLLPPTARLRPPVDYYARLPGIYAAARFSLSLTSLQLPSGLNQRHFDVWMAGGVCLTDASPGLALFPRDLVRPVRFSSPEDIRRAARRAEDYPGGREALIADWRGVILEKHTYRHRAEQVLEILSPARPRKTTKRP
ncbi:MAG: glycosyltransferase [Desulfovibrio sp.]|jgi:hypothetical protein|nr:glycosyltransferase [Desulfovibrio sp.]